MSYDDLRGKTAIVTGSGKKSGIGYGIAEKLAGCGMNVVISDLGRADADCGALAPGTRSEMEAIAEELSERHGVEVMALDLNVCSGESIKSLTGRVGEVFGEVRVLVNNAGATFGVPAEIRNYEEDAWVRTLDVNLNGVFRMTKAVLPMMSQGGAIINIASRAGKVPPLFNGAYAVSKAGVIMLTKVTAKEVAGQGIRVNAICPGQIMTDLEKWRFGLEAQFLNSTVEEREAEMCKTIPLGRIGQPSEVGSLAAFLASDESSYLTGQAINITGGQLMEL